MCIGILIINYVIHPFEFRSKIINLKKKKTNLCVHDITVYIILLCVFIGGDSLLKNAKINN